MEEANWLYETDEKDRARFLLGRSGSRPLLCIGVNPSTARPGKLDNTLKAVVRHVDLHGYAGWMMMNLYPQRATNPNDLHKRCQRSLYEENLQCFARVLEGPPLDIWAAWGTLIEKRPYLFRALDDIYALAQAGNHRFIGIGKPSLKGHPHHPLYLSSREKPWEFPIRSYCQTWLANS
ncbi:MAG: DUF1643 domain-containing protein [Bacteroidota bacterium]